MRFSILVCLMALLVPQSSAAQGISSQTLRSVVSVLPVWPGRAQGGLGGSPGTAPEGSGIVLRPGLIVTAWHVIEPAQRIDVRLSDGRILPAQLVGRDIASDIAVLSVDAVIDPITIAPQPSLAQPVCAIGNAYGLDLSVTCGVVSALNVTNAGFNLVEDFVQTDAAANPGSSGGALVDTEGRLVGMISAIFASEADTNVGVNFAVSTDLLERVVDALVETGDARYPRPGWVLEPPTRSQLTELAAPVVAQVLDGEPAAAAGVEHGDLVVRIGARTVRTPRDASAALAVLPEGQASVEVTVQRNNDLLSLALMLVGPVSAQGDTPNGDVLGDCPHPVQICRVRQAVFPVSSFDPIGSATRIGPGLLVTNRHIVGNRLDAVVQTPNGPRSAQVIPSAYLGDLVLLQVIGLPEDGFIPDLEGTDHANQTFYAVGADVGLQKIRVFDPGDLIAGPAEGADLGRLHVRAQMQPGVSGGALVDDAGTLVGIAVGGGDGRFEAIPVQDVLELLELRQSEVAEEITQRLGAALGDCAAAIDAVASNEPSDIIAPCETAQNHGQLLEAGRSLARIGDIEAAIALHTQAVEQVPNSINGRISLLVSLQLGARFEEMTDHARALIDLAPDDPQALRFAIQSGVWGNAPELAEAGYQALLNADPQQAQAARRFIDSAPPAPVRP